MKKIPTLFVRDLVTRLVVDVVTPGCEWVVEGFGTSTRKWDGTCCRVHLGQLWKRHEVKYRAGAPFKPLPEGWEACGEMDPVTLKSVGWVPVDAEASTDRWHREAFERQTGFLAEHGNAGHVILPMDGTYELIGPKIQGNPEQVDCHILVPHGAESLEGLLQGQILPRSFKTLRLFIQMMNIEGIVFHHPDGRMAKIKGQDFGLKRL